MKIGRKLTTKRLTASYAIHVSFAFPISSLPFA
jgi:hypothetical protein